MLQKVRPNVLFLALLGFIATVIFGWKLVNVLTGSNDDTSTEYIIAVVAVLSAVVGMGVGGLLTLASQVATDPEPPNVPAFIVEKMLEREPWTLEPRIN